MQPVVSVRSHAGVCPCSLAPWDRIVALEVMFSFVVVAATGNDLQGLPIPRERESDGDLMGPDGVRRDRAEETNPEAALLAADILSRATCVTGAALDICGHVPPYQLLVHYGSITVSIGTTGGGIRPPYADRVSFLRLRRF